ncbi:hypothetical protein XAP412_760097 [Xanthomonas phaseoli pv. phaseoli]|uniref:Transposase n=1 Tax=Xanthomonas campestris pv. phaseoli TaxID=317013 RepID=A0AB38E517_XANCH|nr:hypothetical protein XAP6984_800097 [Xanthomonas phaseoli pv. phaseoli]SON90128.1 hypothetical protein XAP412_760097 [Xanthomonas phaseoli pv. phaseoli]SON92428.1 hypothetical protein XAP7430_760097 [Xanthomonas phaseoli pv. phaseoli]
MHQHIDVGQRARATEGSRHGERYSYRIQMLLLGDLDPRRVWLPRSCFGMQQGARHSVRRRCRR